MSDMGVGVVDVSCRVTLVSVELFGRCDFVVAIICNHVPRV